MKRSKVTARRSKTLPDDLLKLETTQGRCPNGHALPNKTNKGRCSPVHCAGSLAGSNDRQPTSETKGESVSTPRVGSALKAAKAQVMAELNAKADEIIDRLLPGETFEMQAARAAAHAQKADELQKIGHQVGRHAAHKAVFKMPEGLQGAEAEDYFKKEAENLLPEIIVDLKRDLQLGDDAQRREARRDILDIVGKRKQENAPNINAALILVNPGGGNVIDIPWSKKKSKTHVIDATPKVLPEGPKGPKGSSDA